MELAKEFDAKKIEGQIREYSEKLDLHSLIESEKKERMLGKSRTQNGPGHHVTVNQLVSVPSYMWVGGVSSSQPSMFTS